MDKVIVGILGAGRIGQLHARNILNSDKYILKAIFDVTIDHLIGTAFEHKVPVITSHVEDLLLDTEINAIFICTPTDTHANYIKQIAKTGKHIFCEKPISFNLAESEDALQLVKEAGVKFQVGFNRRFDKHFRKVYEVVQSGNIGIPHIYKITSRDPEAPDESYIKRSGGMFMDMSIHDFDMIRFLSGREIVEVSVKAANLIDSRFNRNNDVDTSIITLTFDDGSLGVIDNSRQAVYGYDQRIEVFGTEGSVSADNERYTNIQVQTKNSTNLDHLKHFFLDRYEDSYIQEIDSFASSILYDITIACSGEDGLKAELLALAAQMSWKENRSVRMDELLSNSVKSSTRFSDQGKLKARE